MYWIWVAQGRQKIDIDFAWKHAELPLVERKSKWGEKERLRMEGRRLVGSCGVNVDQMVGVGLREWVVILMDSSINRDLAGY